MDGDGRLAPEILHLQHQLWDWSCWTLTSTPRRSSFPERLEWGGEHYSFTAAVTHRDLGENDGGIYGVVARVGSTRLYRAHLETGPVEFPFHQAHKVAVEHYTDLFYQRC